jgi:hypothetical protein
MAKPKKRKGVRTQVSVNSANSHNRRRSSTRLARDTAQLAILTSTGGEHNWNGHLVSADHIRKEKIKPAQTKMLTSFFTTLLKLTRREESAYNR